MFADDAFMHWSATCRYVQYLVYIAEEDLENDNVLAGLCDALGGMQPVQQLHVSKEETYFLSHNDRVLPGLGGFHVPQADLHWIVRIKSKLILLNVLHSIQSRVPASVCDALGELVVALNAWEEEPKTALMNTSAIAPEARHASGASLEVLLRADLPQPELKVIEHCVSLGACARVFVVFGRCCVLYST